MEKYYIVPASKLVTLADALRTQSSTSQKYTIDEMVNALSDTPHLLAVRTADLPAPADRKSTDYAVMTQVRDYGLWMDTFEGVPAFINLQTIGHYCFQYCKYEEVLLYKVAEIPSYAFVETECYEVTLYAATKVAAYAFKDCLNLDTVTFGKKCTISPYAFSDCYNLMVINVPWSEGEVAGAPWGAKNAAINYNSAPPYNPYP